MGPPGPVGEPGFAGPLGEQVSLLLLLLMVEVICLYLGLLLP